MRKLISLILAIVMAAGIAAASGEGMPATGTDIGGHEIREEQPAVIPDRDKEDEDEDEDKDEDGEEAPFADWNPNAPALQALIAYVEAVTDKDSPDYIPPVDRIAVFDMDGTLCAELNPTYLEYYTLAWRILKDPAGRGDACFRPDDP